MSSPPVVLQTEEKILRSGHAKRRSFLGLNNILWRIALVTGIAQLSVSIWTWQFAISLEAALNPWQIGITFASGTVASLVGYPIAGALADAIGRKRALIVSFIPQIAGLIMLYGYSVWPYVLVAYGLQSFGWSFILVISRVMPADQISQLASSEASRKMTMVLMPAFLVDGISPVLAVVLLGMGFDMRTLLLVGAVTAGFSLVASITLVKETLHSKIRNLSKKKIRVPLRDFGRSFWTFTIAMLGYYLAWGMSLPYLGILVVSEWSISLDIYGLSSSIFSITTVVLMYTLSGVAGRKTTKALAGSLIANGMLMAILGLGTGIWMLFIINALWAIPIVIWIASEGILMINGVPNELTGQALGVFQFATASTGMIAAPLGAFIWAYSGNLRFLWIVSGVLATGFAMILWIIMARVKIHKKKPTSNNPEVMKTNPHAH